MAAKKDEAGRALALAGTIGFLSLSIFLFNILFVYRHYDKIYNFSEASARVTDTWNFTRFLPVFVGAAFLVLPALALFATLLRGEITGFYG